MHGALICVEEKLTVWRSLDVSYVEGLIPKEFGADAVEVLGARSLLADLEEAKAPWAIVVSLAKEFIILYRNISDGRLRLDFRYSTISNGMARCHAACPSKEHGIC